MNAERLRWHIGMLELTVGLCGPDEQKINQAMLDRIKQRLEEHIGRPLTAMEYSETKALADATMDAKGLDYAAVRRMPFGAWLGIVLAFAREQLLEIDVPFEV